MCSLQVLSALSLDVQWFKGTPQNIGPLLRSIKLLIILTDNLLLM